jgi:outer membrane lipoprotein-sorting protein
MARIRIASSLSVAFSLISFSALAQAPLPLGPQVAPRAASPAQATPAAPETPQQLVQRINLALNSMTTLVGEFTQTSADGRKRTGRLYVQRPGKLRFDYNPPAQLEVVSDGLNVAVIDKRVPQQDVYGIGQTPLKFLLAERIDVSRDTKVTSVKREKDEIILDIEDKNTLAGTSRIRIHFHGESLGLKRWTVTDPQGMPTTVTLANLSTQQRPERGLFVINYQFNQNRTNN